MRFKNIIIVFLLSLSGFFSFSAQIFASPSCALRYAPKTNKAAAVSEIPLRKKTLISYRNYYSKNTDKKIREIRKILADKSVTQDAKLKDLRKFFVMMRHYAELFTKSGQLPKDIAKLTKKMGKYSDALAASKGKKAKSLRKELVGIAKAIQSGKVSKEVMKLNVAKRSTVKNRVQSTKNEIAGFLSKKKLTELEFHDLKKAVRRLTSVIRSRNDYFGGSHLTDLAAKQKKMIDILGDTTDKIAELKIKGKTKALESARYTVPENVIAPLKTFLNNIVLVSTI